MKYLLKNSIVDTVGEALTPGSILSPNITVSGDLGDGNVTFQIADETGVYSTIQLDGTAFVVDESSYLSGETSYTFNLFKIGGGQSIRAILADSTSANVTVTFDN